MLDLPVQSILHQVDEQKAPISVKGQKATQSEEILTKKAIENIIVKHSMNTLSYKTISANKNTVQKEWVLVDAENQTVGRLATRVANILRGKTKPCFTPHVDCGDNVIIINAEQAVLTGKKASQKYYRRHSGWIGGLKEIKYKDLMEKRPEFAMTLAVKGMLQKNSMAAGQLTRLKVYRGAEHKHAAQKPEVWDR